MDTTVAASPVLPLRSVATSPALVSSRNWPASMPNGPASCGVEAASGAPAAAPPAAAAVPPAAPPAAAAGVAPPFGGVAPPAVAPDAAAAFFAFSARTCRCFHLGSAANATDSATATAL